MKLFFTIYNNSPVNKWLNLQGKSCTVLHLMLLCNKLQTFGVITAYVVYSQDAGAGVQSHHIKRLFRVLASTVEKPPAAERQNKTRSWQSAMTQCQGAFNGRIDWDAPNRCPSNIKQQSQLTNLRNRGTDALIICYSSDSCTIAVLSPHRLPWQPHSDSLVLGGCGKIQQRAEAEAAAGRARGGAHAHRMPPCGRRLQWHFLICF